jgi:hypothetical protein
MEQSLRAIMDIRAQLAFLQRGLGKGQSDYQVSVAPGDLVPFSSFRLANLGRELSDMRSRSFSSKFRFVPAAAMKYRPGDPGELVGEGYGQHIFV